MNEKIVHFFKNQNPGLDGKMEEEGIKKMVNMGCG